MSRSPPTWPSRPASATWSTPTCTWTTSSSSASGWWRHRLGVAFLADPYYDLPALHLLTSGGNKHRLRAFLAGYGWETGPDFRHRAMSMTLVALVGLSLALVQIA